MKTKSKNKSKTIKNKNTRYLVPILIVIIVVIAIASISIMHMLPKNATTLTSLKAPIIIYPNSTSSFFLPAYKYQVFEIPTTGSSSSNYVGTIFNYVVTGNSSVNITLMDEAQFRAFNSSKNLGDNILLQNGTYNVNEFVSNSSGENYYLIVSTDRNSSSVNVKVNSVNYYSSGGWCIPASLGLQIKVAILLNCQL